MLNTHVPYLFRGSVLNTEQPGRRREVKQKIIDMALNGSGVRDTAQVLHVNSLITLPFFPPNKTIKGL